MTTAPARPRLVHRQLHGRPGHGGARRALDLRRAARGVQRRTPLRRHAPPHRHAPAGAHRPARPAGGRRASCAGCPTASPASASATSTARPTRASTSTPCWSPSASGATATSPTPRARRSSSRTCDCGAEVDVVLRCREGHEPTGRRDVDHAAGPGDPALQRLTEPASASRTDSAAASTRGATTPSSIPPPRVTTPDRRLEALDAAHRRRQPLRPGLELAGGDDVAAPRPPGPAGSPCRRPPG